MKNDHGQLLLYDILQFINNKQPKKQEKWANEEVKWWLTTFIMENDEPKLRENARKWPSSKCVLIGKKNETTEGCEGWNWNQVQGF